MTEQRTITIPACAQHGDIRQDLTQQAEAERPEVVEAYAKIGRAVEDSISRNLPDWFPSDCPSEVIVHLINERDAALARVEELERQEPVATVAKVPGEDWNSLDFHRDMQDMEPGTKLYAAPVAQAQHSVPELLVRAEDFVSGFEDDDEQEGVSQLLADLRTAIGRAN
ncbi:TPA: hypothetical protein ACSPK2_001960 [Pseudomonas aeruginosa]|uniref:hypothetical protein n=1 Tax=Pseudomonas aeruginosa TaxID=287 RepID=UPI000F8490B2|nr:hypothetical protein [Pseudomonas aeruginosa]MCO2399933.1 hypothetical protein [Pseudomonas aeruginosa]RTW05934.1 hypothetical protein DY996_06390 [Pseudomonas aeruginosa]HCF3410886.1 hypothetical protein [Pseudomonas aeruginosa]HCF5564091.1 hypothetical protein [Pseudomonas aeruginosa]